MTTAENWQIVNYGIGGHYLSHYDYYTKKDEELLLEAGSGNRIGTFMFYVRNSYIFTFYNEKMH